MQTFNIYILCPNNYKYFVKPYSAKSKSQAVIDVNNTPSLQSLAYEKSGRLIVCNK